MFMGLKRMATNLEGTVGRHTLLANVDWLLVAVLSGTAGAVDVIGFLGLGGLFVAHITGNLVILASHYVTGGFSQTGPLLSVPVFILILGIVTELFLGKEAKRALRALLILHAALLAGFLVLSVGLGPFTNFESWRTTFVGMLGVAAMATQSAMVKLDLPGLPSTSVLTTNTVQLTIDLARLIRGDGRPEELEQSRRRARVTFPTLTGFIAGCAAGAFLELNFGLWALTLPVISACIAILLGELLDRERFGALKQ